MCELFQTEAGFNPHPPRNIDVSKAANTATGQLKTL